MSFQFVNVIYLHSLSLSSEQCILVESVVDSHLAKVMTDITHPLGIKTCACFAIILTNEIHLETNETPSMLDLQACLSISNVLVYRVTATWGYQLAHLCKSESSIWSPNTSHENSALVIRLSIVEGNVVFTVLFDIVFDLC